MQNKEAELQKHIDFAEKQYLVYKYHDNPDMLRMKALYNFLLDLKNNEQTTPSDTNCNSSPVDSVKPVQPKEETKTQGSLFDISKFTKVT